MLVTNPEGQRTFSDQFFDKGDEPDLRDHPYVRMGEIIEWDRIYLGLGKHYNGTKGSPSKSVRVMVLLHMVKHYENESDVDMVERLRTNIALQKACNLTYLESQRYLNPSSMSRFRERIGEEGARLIEEEVERYLGGKRARRGKSAVLDTTVTPSDIAYPTDINLMEKGRQLLLRFIKRFKHWTGKRYRTKSRKGRREYLQYIKLKRRDRKLTRKTHGRMLRFLKRNLKQTEEVLEVILKKKGKDKTIKRWEATIGVIRTLMGQQMEIFHKMKRNGSKAGIHIKGRIVSIFRPYVRPMPRGKTPVATEFGAKILTECRNGFMKVLDATFDNEADCEMVKGQFWRWKGMNLGGDRGMDSPANRTEAGSEGVNYLVERRSRKSQPRTHAVTRIRGKRAAIEAKYSLGKRRHGLERVRYHRGAWSEIAWVRWGLMAMNLKLAFKRYPVQI